MTPVAQMTDDQFFAWHFSIWGLSGTCRNGHAKYLHWTDRCRRCQLDSQKRTRAKRKAVA